MRVPGAGGIGSRARGGGTRRTWATLGVAPLLLLAVVPGGCGGGGDKAVKVHATEFSLKPDRSSVGSGNVKFAVDNDGGLEHEFVVVRAADVSSLPTKADGSVDESRIPESDKVGEIPGVPPDKTKSATFRVEKGSYVAFCNITNGKGAGAVNHFKNGMHTTFTVK
ncbi:MAG: hypothetical protein U0V73_15800 [Acidimicrobiia bacterium]